MIYILFLLSFSLFVSELWRMFAFFWKGRAVLVVLNSFLDQMPAVNGIDASKYRPGESVKVRSSVLVRCVFHIPVPAMNILLIDILSMLYLSFVSHSCIALIF